MSGFLRLVLAQVGAETRTRLRSTSTLVAAVALFVASFLWIQDPASRAVSLSWRLAQGGRATGIYSAGFVGTVAAVLAVSFLPLIGFYLVAGSVRRDRESGIGAILAATPFSSTTYLVGKWLAHVSYLLVLQGLAVVSGACVFWRYGTGAFDPAAFLAPSLFLVTPAIVFTAALAVLFDVAPALRGRGGLVLYFFVWVLLFFVIPALLGGMFRPVLASHPPLFDPGGVATIRYLVATAVPDSVPNSVSVGVIVDRDPVQRVPWPDVALSPALMAFRAAGLLFVLPLLAGAVLSFDRFDPARSGGGDRAGPPRPWSRRPAGPGPVEGVSFDLPSPGLQPVRARPSPWGATVAEARLVWDTASWLRWPLLVAAAASAVAPAGSAAFLILLAPVIAEVAARESLSGTGPLVFSQPGVPSATVLWKAAAVALFVFTLGAPTALRAFATSPARGIAWVTGLAFVVAFAVGAGSLSRGGKLFTSVYTALWYVAVSGPAAGPFDYSGAFGGGLDARVRLTYLALGAAVLGLASFVERRRRG